MAKAPQRPTLTSPKGAFKFPKLTVADTKFKEEGEYSVKLVVSADTPGVAQLISKCDDAAAESLKEANPKPTEGTPKKAPQDNGWAYHTIVEGDTLFALGRKFSTSVDQIVALNPGIKIKSLKVGQTIRVR